MRIFLQVMVLQTIHANMIILIDVAADNAVLEDYATNALLTIEERKIVALLERIEIKFETLNEDEKVEVRNYKTPNYSYSWSFFLVQEEDLKLPGPVCFNLVQG